MKKLFIIGTGRNGSKLAAHCMSANLRSKETDLHGEVHGGLKPEWFLLCYLHQMEIKTIRNKFKAARDIEIAKCKEIYIEKNHLIVPILDVIRQECYPDAKFLYIQRNPADIVRSYANRDPYVPANMNNMYGRGRLIPTGPSAEKYRTDWMEWNNFEKSCWYVFEMIRMIELFMGSVKDGSLEVLNYSDMVHRPHYFENIYDWAGLNYDLNKIKAVLNKPIGTSCKKSYPAYKDWTKEMKDHFHRMELEVKSIC